MPSCIPARCEGHTLPDRQGAHACNVLLDMPQVTLLFLSRGEMFHERLWAAWLGAVAGLLPLQYVRV